MPGTICLQGGDEFAEACREMDADVLARAGGGRVVVSALAGRPGHEYDVAGANGQRHFQALGAADVIVAPDARSDPDGAAAAMAGADLLVLPGGAPSRLLSALQDTPAGDCVLEVLQRGAVVMGSSAGAMVLCERTLLPDTKAPVGSSQRGLGVVAGVLVVPHARDESQAQSTFRALTPRIPVLALPEHSGVVVGPDRSWTGVGESASILVDGNGVHRLAPGEMWRPTG